MAKITGLTAARMLLIEQASVISGKVVGTKLILTKKSGATIDAGDVKGPKGDKGDTGVAGEQGPIGPSGGPKGDKGDTGDPGPKGDKGDIGPAGPAGADGAGGAGGGGGAELNYRGDWSPSAAYAKNDAVFFFDTTYKAVGTVAPGGLTPEKQVAGTPTESGHVAGTGNEDYRASGSTWTQRLNLNATRSAGVDIKFVNRAGNATVRLKDADGNQVATSPSQVVPTNAETWLQFRWDPVNLTPGVYEVVVECTNTASPKFTYTTENSGIVTASEAVKRDGDPVATADSRLMLKFFSTAPSANWQQISPKPGSAANATIRGTAVLSHATGSYPDMMFKVEVGAEVVEDSHGWWSNSQKRYTPKRGGRYLVTGTFTSTNEATGNSCLGVMTNGFFGQLTRGYQKSPGGNVVVSQQVLLDGVDDFIELFGCNSDGNIPGDTTLDIVYLGPATADAIRHDHNIGGTATT